MATAECLYTQTKCSGPRVPTLLRRTVALHMPPSIYLQYCTFEDLVFSCCTVDVMFVCASHSSKWIPCQGIPRKVIWSWFADLADMECITFLEFREENQPSNANQISHFLQTSIHDSGIPHDPHRKFSEIQSSHQKERWSIQVHFYLGLSSFLVLPLSSDRCCIEAPAHSKASLKHVCTVPTKRNARAPTGGKKPWG